MSTVFMRNLRLLWVCVALPLSLALVSVSYAQDQTEPAAAAEQEPAAETQAEPATTDEASGDAPASQTALEQALQTQQAAETAKAEADAAVVEAARKLLAEQEGAPGVETNTAPEEPVKPSMLDPDNLKAMGMGIVDKIVGWLKSPSFLAQIGALILAYFLAPIIAKAVRKRVFLFRDPPADGVRLRLIRDYVYQSGNFLRAIMLVALLALFALVLKNIPALGQDWLVKLAQGLAVVFLLYKAIKQFIPNALAQKLAIWIIIPLAVLMVFGYFDDLINFLETTTIMSMGDTPISLMTLVRLAIFGGVFFWLGGISNSKGQDAIRSQESLDIATREVVAKIFQILLFIILAVLVLNFAGIPLSGLVMIFSAVGLGIGFGLQPIAANFVSGLIILFDRSVKVGDFVVLPDGQEGVVDAINMRSTIVETYDGKDIMVPNTKFTEDAYENWTHKDPRQRYEVDFAVPYNTDLDELEDMLLPEVLKHPQVLKEPEMPDLELRRFGDNGIHMAIEFWCEGVDDGPNKFTSDVMFIVWRTLKANGISMPFPQREVRNLN